LTDGRVNRSLSDIRGRHRKIYADLLDQKIKLYHATTVGERARALWRLINQRLLHGEGVEITVSALKLDWHREELRRAKAVLADMQLIEERADGRYLLGPLGPFSKIDELIRDQHLDLKLLERAVVAIAAITAKSKTRRRRRPPASSQNSERTLQRDKK
jgi:hypothetical protein